MKPLLAVLALVLFLRPPSGGDDKNHPAVPIATGSVALEVFFPPTDPRHPRYNEVQEYLLNKSSPAFPLISGAAIRIEWSDFDFGDVKSGTHSKYDFKLVDEMIAPWLAAGKVANLVLHATTYGAPANCPQHGSESNGQSGTGNCAMPPWMWTALTESNYTTCDGSQVPNFFSSAYQTNYQAAISALVKHYAGNAGVGYIRPGLGKGGEINIPRGWNDPSIPCGDAYTTRWGYTIGDSEKYTWNAYLKKMVEFEGTLTASKQLMVGITQVKAPGVSPQEVADYIAPIAVKYGVGFGDQGLSAQSMRDCTGVQADWCALFERFQGKVPLELQTLGKSCPEGTDQCDDQGREHPQNQNRRGGGGFGGPRRWPGAGPGGPGPGRQGRGGQGGGGQGPVTGARLSSMTGSLVPLLSFGIKHHATILEIYCEDWLVAFSPNHPENARYGADYAQAIKQAAQGK